MSCGRAKASWRHEGTRRTRQHSFASKPCSLRAVTGAAKSAHSLNFLKCSLNEVTVLTVFKGFVFANVCVYGHCVLSV